MSDFNEAEYQAAIPACCAFQSWRDHMEHLMLCWGLAAAIRDGRPMDCSGCEMAFRTTPTVGAVHD